MIMPTTMITTTMPGPMMIITSADMADVGSAAP